ncbi:MAG: 50S ribosomal protein L31e [Candidatus Nanoarchaeia archaeon]|nr:50S ribosomal protein L31e [Candidatus Nanoarchaeia archaeon]
MAKTEIKSEKIEREYIIPLRVKWKHAPSYKKTNRAVKAVKEFLVRHMTIRDRDLNKVRIDKLLNEYLWQRSIQNPPSKIKVKAVKENGIVRVEMAELPQNLKFKKIRFENRDKKAVEIADKKKSAIEKLKEARENKEEENKAQETAEEVHEKEEKKAAVAEAGKELEKEMAKSEKHEIKAKSPKQVKNDRVGYNQASRGK